MGAIPPEKGLNMGVVKHISEGEGGWALALGVSTKTEIIIISAGRYASTHEAGTDTLKSKT